MHLSAGNIGNVPLVLIAALCRDKSNPFGDSNKCSQDGNAYISFGQWVCCFSLLVPSYFIVSFSSRYSNSKFWKPYKKIPVHPACGESLILSVYI